MEHNQEPSEDQRLTDSGGAPNAFTARANEQGLTNVASPFLDDGYDLRPLEDRHRS